MDRYKKEIYELAKKSLEEADDTGEVINNFYFFLSYNMGHDLECGYKHGLGVLYTSSKKDKKRQTSHVDVTGFVS